MKNPASQNDFEYFFSINEPKSALNPPRQRILSENYRNNNDSVIFDENSFEMLNLTPEKMHQ